ncbi:MAG TPA: fibronectin type III domain-containing protein [Candidatus Saccharimonadales bacterium]|nr:fibronectin type III domain-containing protein [Candidatus Saccharimonadales bacterium]
MGLAVLLAVPVTAFLYASEARAATPGSLYSYSLDGASATIPNAAASNTNVAMALQGSWAQTSFGVQFEGNLTNKQSVGYAKPASGSTLTIPASQAIGASVLLKYKAPVGANCFSDSPNISQIGKFLANTTQFKLQLSNCGKSSTNVYPQCRVAGASTPTSVLPVMGSTPLVNGETYIIQCVKSPDPVSGNATVQLKTTHIDMVNGHTTTTNNFSVAKTGNMNSTQYLSVGNKYPTAPQTNNTDQFNGEVSKLAYCTGADIAAAQTCLETEVPAPVVTPPDPVPNLADEIHFAYGDTDNSVVFNWRGTENTIYYGLTSTYGQQVTANPSPITPWDIQGPFWEAHLEGLATDTTYHYKIGETGTDKTFRTKPTGDFTWVDIGDTKSSYCAPWMPAQHALIAAQNPHFVTHGGDIGLLNECGIPSTHSYYTDQEAWSHSAAFQPAWGNHEYGNPTPDAPPGTPRDSLANYKGRSWITNAQTVPVDTPTRISNPGCGEESGSTVNLCLGRDWGYFTAGRVLFISYPENWTSGWTDWQTKAGNIMAVGQANSNIDFIVTYGHRPPYTSSGEGPNLTIRSTVEALAATYSPTASNPNGKYILNVAHHAHSQEAFNKISGLTHIVDAAGGQGFTSFTSIDPNSVFRSMHFGILKGNYNATDRTLTVSLVCGAEYTTVKDPCNYGDTICTTTFQRSEPAPDPDPNPDPDPTPPPTTTEWVTNTGVETDMTGWTGKYGASSTVSVVRDATVARTGTASVKITGLSGASNLKSGINASPRWVTSTVAGKTYTGSVWVKTHTSGHPVVALLREWNGSTLVSENRATVTSTSTDWFKLEVPLTALQTGTSIAFAIYGNDVDAGEYIYLDDFSLTSPAQ